MTGYLRYFTDFVEGFPIPCPSDEQRTAAESAANRLITLREDSHRRVSDLLHWLKFEYEIVKPSTRLSSPLEMEVDTFVTEVKKIRGKKKPLSLAALKSLREEHERTIVPAQALAREALGLERRISDLVNVAYGLTPEEVRLMWDTAPPRMPIPGPSPDGSLGEG